MHSGWGQVPPNQQQGWNHPSTNQASLFNDQIDYIITTALDKNLVLDASQDFKNKNKMIFWKKHGKQNQRFKIRFANGKYQIINGQGFALDGSNILKGDQQIRVDLPNYTSNGQYWQILPVQGQPNTYFIRSFCSKVVDVFQGAKKKGIKIILWDFNNGKNQKWHINPV